MELNITFFSNISKDNNTNGIGSETEAKPNSFLMYLSLFGLPLGVVLVAVPALVVIIIILKNRKLREKSYYIFYVNVLITDLIAILVRWIISSTIVICYLLGVPNVNCNVIQVSHSTSSFAMDLMFLPVVIDRFLHIACPISYKRMFTTKRIAIIRSGFWLQALVCGTLALVGQDYIASPESGLCTPIRSAFAFKLFALVILGMFSYIIYTHIGMYLHLINQDYFIKFL